MRVLHIVGSMDRGGVESRTMDIYRNIDRNSVQFDFLVRSNKKGHFDDEIISLGGKIIFVRRKLPNLLEGLLNSTKAMSGYKIVHMHSSNAYDAVLNCFCALLAGAKIRIIHSRSNSDVQRVMLHKILKLLIPLFANYYFSISQVSGEWMFSKGLLNENRYIKVYDAIDSKKYIYNTETRIKLRKQLGLEGKFVIGHVGRFNIVKNHNYLIKVFEKIARNIPESVLMLVGDGELREKIESQITELNIADKAVLLGVRDDVPDLMQAMDVLVFPSVFEGFGDAVLEAQAAGLKAIVSDKITKETEIVKGLVDFLPIDNSVDTWVDTIINCYNYKTERQNTHEKIVEAGFDIKASTQWYEAFYLSLGKRQSARPKKMAVKRYYDIFKL